jgi:hypothetical protein
VTLGRLVLAWVIVALWFAAAVWVGRRAAGRTWPPQGRAAARALGWTAAEAAVLTLFASLWFDSLGSGGWWLLFLLLGLLVAFPIRLEDILTGVVSRRAGLALAIADTSRYLVAGALLAWRLR